VGTAFRTSMSQPITQLAYTHSLVLLQYGRRYATIPHPRNSNSYVIVPAHRPVFIIAFVGYTMFQIGDALAPNTASLLVFRFLGGAFAAW
jgi:MFS family permease